MWEKMNANVKAEINGTKVSGTVEADVWYEPPVIGRGPDRDMPEEYEVCDVNVIDWEYDDGLEHDDINDDDVVEVIKDEAYGLSKDVWE